jgi:hypothetical protein
MSTQPYEFSQGLLGKLCFHCGTSLSHSAAAWPDAIHPFGIATRFVIVKTHNFRQDLLE